MHYVYSLPPIKNLNNLATNEQKSKAFHLLHSMIENIEISSTQTSYSIESKIELDFCIDGFTDNQKISQQLSQDRNEIESYLNSNI